MSRSPNKKSSSSKKPIVNARATSSSSSTDFRPADVEFVEAVKKKYKIQVPESYRKDTVKQPEVVEIHDENNKMSVDVVTGILLKY